jgi:hypothetical protein
MAKDRINPEARFDLNPCNGRVPTDDFYLNLSNEVRQVIAAGKYSQTLQDQLSKEGVDIMACFLTSYLEDLVSGTNIWNAFVTFHLELYHKPLPFFKTENYEKGGINQQDISFLIWYFINTLQQEGFISPYNDLIFETEDIYDVLVKARDNAPVNESLKKFYTIGENETDYYKARELIDNILFKTYLFYPDTKATLATSVLEISERNEGDENLMNYLSENRDQILHQSHTKLLSLTGKEWAAKVLGENHSLSDDYLKMSKKITGLFLYKGQDLDDIYIEHIASGKKFKLTRKSFDHARELTKVDTILFLGIVKWQNEWWFSGTFFDMPYNADVVKEEKDSLESRHAVSFLDYQEKNVDDILEKQYKAFKNFTDGHQIVFLESEKIGDFYRNYLEYYTETLNLTEKEKEESKKRSEASGFFGKQPEFPDFTETAESGLIFFNPDTGAEIGLGANSAFPLPHNPFFDKKESEGDIKALLMSDSLSKELVMFCIDHCKSELLFFTKGEGKIYLPDIDFLLRYWKNESYFSEPSITLI